MFVAVDLRPLVSSSPEASQVRFDRLEQYASERVLGPDGMCCRHYPDCRTGAEKKGLSFSAGQLSYVGPQYETAVHSVPFRILVVGMDTGRTDSGVTMTDRRRQVQRVKDRRERNPHMNGTLLGLQVLFGIEPRSGPESEVWGDGVHLLDSFAMANLRLCSATKTNVTSYGTKQMSRNCLEHLASTIQILEPTIVITQGKELWPWIRDMSGEAVTFEQPERVQLAGVSVVLAAFRHPAHGNWQSDRCKYFNSTVRPALQSAQQLGLTAPGDSVSLRQSPDCAEVTTVALRR